MDILVTYDIRTKTAAGERRLAAVAATCERYGERVQYSVFQCRLSATRYERLRVELSELLEPGDVIDFYRFPGSLEDARLRIGIPPPELGRPWIV